MAGTPQVESMAGHFKASGARTVTLLPDPPRKERFHTIISVDDHLVEPPNAFEGRLPSKLADRAPRVVPMDGGGEAWLYDDKLLPNIALAAASGRPAKEWGVDPQRFEDMRRGAWDPVARLHDMDLDGVYASMNFPSFLPGFGGGRLQQIADLELALACVRAYNEWHVEAWCGADPARFIPLQIPWLHDPVVGAEEIRRNAGRGFKAVTFPEHPERLGFPSVFTEHWDPFMRACEETDTVVCLHTGSGGGLPNLGDDAPPALSSLVFGAYALIPTATWLYSMIPVRFPDIKFCISEGGIGWVSAVFDRLEHLMRHQENPQYFGPWFGLDLKPADVLHRNFYFCAVDDDSAWVNRHRIGIDHLMVEVDYPHPDASWPNTQEQFRSQLKDVPADEAALITWGNASRVFRHPVPEAVQRDPDSF